MQPRRLSSSGSAQRQPWKTPPRSMSIARCQSSGPSPSTSPSGATPALLTITSTPPKRSTAAATRARTSSSRATSQRWTRVRAGSRVAATDSSLSGVRPASTTQAPSAAKRSAMPRPMPEPAPVTMTTRSVKRRMRTPATGAAIAPADGKRRQAARPMLHTTHHGADMPPPPRPHGGSAATMGQVVPGRGTPPTCVREMVGALCHFGASF